jgi:hypothetical protein
LAFGCQIGIIGATRWSFGRGVGNSLIARDLAGVLEALRARLQRMSERELLSFGQAARYMCLPAANQGKGPRQVFVIQLGEAATEWRRRQSPATVSRIRFFASL